MTENYIQYAGEYQKDNINETHIEKVFEDIQMMDDKHGAFGFLLLLMVKI